MLFNELHSLYLLAPQKAHDQDKPPRPPGEVLSIFLARLDHRHRDQKVALRVGIDESWLRRCGHHPRPPPHGDAKKLQKYDEQMRLFWRLLHAMILAELIDEVPVDTVAADFKVNSGEVASLQENAGRLAASVVALCDALGHDELVRVLGGVQDRIVCGAKAEIVELTKLLPNVSSTRARMLYNAGFHSVQAIAALPNADKLTDALIKASARTPGPQSKRCEQKAAKRILDAARQAVSEMQRTLCEELQALPAPPGGGGGDGALPLAAASPAAALHAAAPPLPLSAAAATPALLALLSSAGAGAGPSPLAASIAAEAASLRVEPPPLPPPPALPPPAALSDAHAAAVATAVLAPPRTVGAITVHDVVPFEALRRRWGAASEYAFCVAMTEPASQDPPPARGGRPSQRATGCAVTFDGRIIFWVSFTGPGGDYRRSVACALLALPGPRKATCDAKLQVQALACRAPRAEAPTACLAALGEGVEDIRIMAWLDCPNDRHLDQKLVATGTDHVVERLGLDRVLIDAAGRFPAFAAPNAAAAAAARVAAAAWPAAAALRPMLAQKQLLEPLVLEMQLVPVLAGMELSGMGFAPETMRAQLSPCYARLKQLKAEVRRITRVPQLNPHSNPEVSAALFRTMQLQPPVGARFERNGNGKQHKSKQEFAVGTKVLQELRRGDPRAVPVVDALLAWRRLDRIVRCARLRRGCRHVARPATLCAGSAHARAWLPRACAPCSMSESLLACVARGATGVQRVHGKIFQARHHHCGASRAAGLPALSSARRARACADQRGDGAPDDGWPLPAHRAQSNRVRVCLAAPGLAARRVHARAARRLRAGARPRAAGGGLQAVRAARDAAPRQRRGAGRLAGGRRRPWRRPVRDARGALVLQARRGGERRGAHLGQGHRVRPVVRQGPRDARHGHGHPGARRCGAGRALQGGAARRDRLAGAVRGGGARAQARAVRADGGRPPQAAARPQRIGACSARCAAAACLPGPAAADAAGARGGRRATGRRARRARGWSGRRSTPCARRVCWTGARARVRTVLTHPPRAAATPQGSAADVIKRALVTLQRHLAADAERSAVLVLSVRRSLRPRSHARVPLTRAHAGARRCGAGG